MADLFLCEGAPVLRARRRGRFDGGLLHGCGNDGRANLYCDFACPTGCDRRLSRAVDADHDRANLNRTGIGDDDERNLGVVREILDDATDVPQAWAGAVADRPDDKSIGPLLARGLGEHLARVSAHQARPRRHPEAASRRTPLVFEQPPTPFLEPGAHIWVKLGLGGKERGQRDEFSVRLVHEMRGERQGVRGACRAVEPTYDSLDTQRKTSFPSGAVQTEQKWCSPVTHAPCDRSPPRSGDARTNGAGLGERSGPVRGLYFSREAVEIGNGGGMGEHLDAA